MFNFLQMIESENLFIYLEKEQVEGLEISHSTAQRQVVNNLLFLSCCRIIEEFSKTASDPVPQTSSFHEDVANWREKISSVLTRCAHQNIPSVTPLLCHYHRQQHLPTIN
jgi:hypothetical protein